MSQFDPFAITISELDYMVHSIPAHHEFTADELADLTQKSRFALECLQSTINRLPKSQQPDDGILAFLIIMQRILAEMEELISDERSKRAPSKRTFYTLTAAFEKYVRNNISRPALDRMRICAGYIPFIDQAIIPCETLPWIWDHCSRRQKIALMVAAAVVVTAIVLTICVYASPVVAGIPAIAIGITVMAAVGLWAYRQLAYGPQQKQQEDKKMLGVIHDIEQQNKTINSMLAEKYPALAQPRRHLMDPAHRHADEERRPLLAGDEIETDAERPFVPESNEHHHDHQHGLHGGHLGGDVPPT